MEDGGKRRLAAWAHQATSDAASQAGALALAVFAVVLFLAGAIVGIGMIGRLGGAGWIIYVVVIATYALLFGPVVASAVTLHQRGSRRHREAKERRLEADRRYYGLHTRGREPRDEGG